MIFLILWTVLVDFFLENSQSTCVLAALKTILYDNQFLPPIKFAKCDLGIDMLSIYWFHFDYYLL